MDKQIPPPPSFQCENCECVKCIKFYANYEARVKQRINHKKHEAEKKAAKKREKEAIAKQNDALHLKYKCKQFVNERKNVYSYHTLPYSVSERRRCLNKKIEGSDYCNMHFE